MEFKAFWVRFPTPFTAYREAAVGQAGGGKPKVSWASRQGKYPSFANAATKEKNTENASGGRDRGPRWRLN